jgi:prepilin-type N-terminal cleavage/methylation domain-containing protein/prepilin-type processing-associated H-X9-DG protein
MHVRGCLVMKRRPAFTLIELLVVMGIIAILVAFLLPAFLASRGASRRISCVNNLKEIDLAIQGYLTTYNVLPAGSYDASGPVLSTPEARAVSWIVSLLPYMEQTGLYHAFDPAYGANAPENHTVAMARLNTLTCPAERPPGNVWFFAGAAPLRANDGPFSSYAGCQNDVETPIDQNNNGVFYLNSRVRIVDVYDGLSQTFFVGEVIKSSPLGWVSGTRATLRNTGQPLNGLDRTLAEEASPGPPPLPSDLNGLEFEGMITSGQRNVAPTYVGGFGSRHPGGANFAFGDGSVRFVRQRIDPTVYQRLGNRADGEFIDDEAF